MNVPCAVKIFCSSFLVKCSINVSELVNGVV